MSRRAYIIVAFVIAGLLTLLGWQQVLIYKLPPPHKFVAWFPLLVLIPLPDELLGVLFSLVQFPLFAAGFAFGIRRWHPLPVAIAVLLAYGLCVAAAFTMMRFR